MIIIRFPDSVLNLWGEFARWKNFGSYKVDASGDYKFLP